MTPRWSVFVTNTYRSVPFGIYDNLPAGGIHFLLFFKFDRAKIVLTFVKNE